jgi:CheY-like chemotaxis protein
VIDAAVETAQPLVSSKGQRMRMNVPDKAIKVLVDPVRTAQMLSNLVINAAKYSAPGSEIELEAELEPDWLRFRVRDGGVGIAPDMLSKIFEIFAQVRTPAQPQNGLGIGLALVRGLAELHGGSVTASSEGLGKGSEFVLALARVAAPEKTEASSEPVVEPSASRRILLADDNLDALETLKLLLEMDGHETETASDGEAALSVADQMLPEVMLLDLGMPRLNGFELAAKVRQRPWGNQTMLIALTGWGQAEMRQRSLAAGFNHHLTKPVDYQLLKNILNANPRESSG